jgi:hypothetical protein
VIAVLQIVKGAMHPSEVWLMRYDLALDMLGDYNAMMQRAQDEAESPRSKQPAARGVGGAGGERHITLEGDDAWDQLGQWLKPGKQQPSPNPKVI